MKKKLLLFLIPAAVYILLSAAGFGVTGTAGGLVYRIMIIAALLYACSRAFAGAAREGGDRIHLTGALGLGTFAVNEIFLLAYIYLLKGAPSDITIGNYSRNCAYLFFMAVVLSLIESPAKRMLRIRISMFSFAATAVILYAVITNDPRLLYDSALALVILCVLPTIRLLFHSYKIKKLKSARIFAYSILAVSVLDSLNRLLIIYSPGWYWRDIILAFYPTVYLMIGFSLTALRKEAADNG